MGIQKVMVAGAGLMGTGIAQVVAQAGIKVTVRDVSADALAQSQAKMKSTFDKLVSKGKLSEDEVQAAMGQMTFTDSLQKALDDADYVIEAVPENLALKQNVFQELDKAAAPHTILATNTSELKVGSLAEATQRPDKVIGTHWFFPAPVMRLIEVIRGDQTSDETLKETLHLCARLGKETVVCRDSQGFITSRCYSALVAEALRIHAEGIASLEDIDKAMRLGFNFPMGPFECVDMSGVDTVYHNLEGLEEAYGERYHPTDLMKKLVERNNLGRKTGKGFFKYAK